MTDPMHIFQRMSVASLRELAAELDQKDSGELPSYHRICQIVGANHASQVHERLGMFSTAGWMPGQLSILLSEIADARTLKDPPENFLEIVLSGPEVPGIPTRDTAAVFRAMVAKATEEILLVGYAIYNGKKLFAPIARQLEERPEIRPLLVLNIPRNHRDTSLDSEIVRRFAGEFKQKHWPWEIQPEIYYDPRALAEDFKQRASLHAKCVVIDRKMALITSANFTEAAQTKNTEAGVLVNHKPFAARIASYFEGLVLAGYRRLDLS